jgi:hypothetical protein
VTLVKGGVGLIKVELDWQNLGSVPIKITISEVFACIRLRPLASSDESETEPEPEPEEEPRSRKLPSFIEKKVEELKANFRKIAENIQFTLTDVHVRMEDDVTDVGIDEWDADKRRNCFALGVTIDALSITNAVQQSDGQWRDEFVDEPMQITTKRIALGEAGRDRPSSGLAVYCNCGPGRWDEGGGRLMPRSVTRKTKVFMKAMRQAIYSDQLSYVIHPIQTDVILRVENSQCAAWAEKDTRVKKGVRLVRAAKTDSPFEVQLRKQPFLDGSYRYEPLTEVIVKAKAVSVTLDSWTLRYFLSLGKWTAEQNGGMGTDSSDDGDSSSSSSDEESSSSSSSSSEDDSSSSEDDSSDDEEQKAAAAAATHPLDWTKLRLAFELKKASLTLTRKAGALQIRHVDLLALNCTVEIRQGGGISIKCGLGDLTLQDTRTDTVVLHRLHRHGCDVRSAPSESLLLDLRVETGYCGGQRCDLTRLNDEEDWNLRLRATLQPVEVVLNVYSLRDLEGWKSDILADHTDEGTLALADKAMKKYKQKYKAAVKAAKANAFAQAVSAATSGADKIYLDVELSPPVLIIPSNNGSRDDPEHVKDVRVELGNVRVETRMCTRREVLRVRSRRAHRGRRRRGSGGGYGDDVDDDDDEEEGMVDVLSVALRGLSVKHGGDCVINAVDVEVELLLQALLSAGKLSTLWQHMDADRSGTLDEDELQQLLALMGMGNGNAAAISADVLDEIDEDGDGEVSQSEFKGWWKRYHRAHLQQQQVASEIVDVELDEMVVKPSDDFYVAMKRAWHLGRPKDKHVSLQNAEFPRGFEVGDSITCDAADRRSARKGGGAKAQRRPTGDSSRVARQLRSELGITSLQVRKNRSWGIGLGQAYEICFDVERTGIYTFTDVTGDVVATIECDEAPQQYTKAFSSDTPSLVLVDTGEVTSLASRAATVVENYLGDAIAPVVVDVLFNKLDALSTTRLDETVPTEELLLKLINSVPNARRILSVLETAGEVREFFASKESSETTYQQIESAIRQVDVSMVKSLRVMLANADDRATPVLWRQAVFGLNSPRARRSV